MSDSNSAVEVHVFSGEEADMLRTLNLSGTHIEILPTETAVDAKVAVFAYFLSGEIDKGIPCRESEQGVAEKLRQGSKVVRISRDNIHRKPSFWEEFQRLKDQKRHSYGQKLFDIA